MGVTVELISNVYLRIEDSPRLLKNTKNSLENIQEKPQPQNIVYQLHQEDITKTRLYTFDLLKPHFYIVKLGYTGIYIILLIFSQKHGLLVLVRTASPGRF